MGYSKEKLLNLLRFFFFSEKEESFFFDDIIGANVYCLCVNLIIPW